MLYLLVIMGCEPESLLNEIEKDPIVEQVSLTLPNHNEEELSKAFYQRHEDPELVMKLLDVKPSEIVADIGCSVGFYTEKLSQAVGEQGIVYAIDVQENAISLLKELIKQPEKYPYKNVFARVNSIDSTGLEPGILDLAFMAHLDFYGYKLLPENEKMLKSTCESLKTTGRLSIVQVDLPTMEHIVPNFEQAGCSFVRELDLGLSRYYQFEPKLTNPGLRQTAETLEGN